MAYDLDLAERVRDALASEPDLDERAMFGGLAFLLAGNMAVVASGGGGLMVRSSAAEVPGLLEGDHVEPVRMGERTMGGWVRVAPAGLVAEADLDRWVAVGVARARELPPKG